MFVLCSPNLCLGSFVHLNLFASLEWDLLWYIFHFSRFRTKKLILWRMLTRPAPIHKTFHVAFGKLGRIYLDLCITLNDTRWFVWRMGYCDPLFCSWSKPTTENMHHSIGNYHLVQWFWGWHSLHFPERCQVALSFEVAPEVTPEVVYLVWITKQN